MPQHIGKGFQKDALDLQHHVRREGFQRRQLLHLPVHLDARSRQARLQPVAQGGQHRGQVAIHRLHRIHRHAQFIERGIGVLAQFGAAGAALADEAEQAHQLRAHAVVNVAHDALALLQRCVLRVFLLQQVVADLQLALALAHLLVQRVAQALVGARLPAVAAQDEPAHQQHEQHGRQRQHGGASLPRTGNAHRDEVVDAGTDRDEAGQAQRDRLGLARHHRVPGRQSVGKERGRKQQRQAQRPEPGHARSERARDHHDLHHQPCPESLAHARSIAPHHRQREAGEQQQMDGQCKSHEAAPQRPAYGRCLPQPVAIPHDAKRCAQRKVTIYRLAVQAPQPTGNHPGERQ
ncbi:hypothetical protein ASF16_23230 [Acidovorax sp. Leaf78]|nr:hypothetical protein ASF16_23230 [Acidovorax sp. Leaf78]